MGFLRTNGSYHHIKIQQPYSAGPRRSSMSMGGGGWKVLGGAIGGAGACQWIHPGVGWMLGIWIISKKIMVKNGNMKDEGIR